MATTSSSLDLLDQVSPSTFVENKSKMRSIDLFYLALALDIAMREISQNGHDDERMVLVFNAFDQIIPQLGVFSAVAAVLRNEFFGIDQNWDELIFEKKFILVSKLDFIYSNQFTVEQVQEKSSKKRKRIPCLERLSYKILCQRLIDQHDERSNNYENKISDIETK